MEFRSIIPDDEVLRITAPPHVRAVFSDEQAAFLCIGGFAEQKLVSYALFSHIVENGGSEVRLNYLYTVPPMRERGCCSALLHYCETLLSEKHITGILAENYLRPEHAPDYHDFMTHRGFIPLNLSGRLLTWLVEDLWRPGALQLVLENKDRLPPALGFREAGQKKVSAFLRSQAKEDASEREVESPFSRYLMDQDKVDSALLAFPLDPESLFLSGVLLGEVAKKRSLFLELFADCLEKAEKEMPRLSRLCFRLEDEAAYQGLMKVFNPPEEELLILEHMLRT